MGIGHYHDVSLHSWRSNMVVTRFRCSWLVREDGSITQMTDDQRTTLITGVIDAMSTQGLRTIAVAFRDFVSSGLYHIRAPCVCRNRFRSVRCLNCSLVDITVLLTCNHRYRL